MPVINAWTSYELMEITCVCVYVREIRRSQVEAMYSQILQVIAAPNRSCAYFIYSYSNLGSLTLIGLAKQRSAGGTLHRHDRFPAAETYVEKGQFARRLALQVPGVRLAAHSRGFSKQERSSLTESA